MSPSLTKPINDHKGANGHDKAFESRETQQVPSWRFDTLQVHAGLEKSPRHGECSLPIYNAAAFKFDSTADAEATFEELGLKRRYTYSRLTNPTNTGFEKRIAALEAGTEAIAFPSGSSAILTMIMSLAGIGDNVIVSQHLYGGTYHIFTEIIHQFGIEDRLCDTNDIAKVEELIDDKTTFVFTETISNPKLSVADLEPLAALCHHYQMPLVVDGTFTAAGYFCQPGKWGADLVVHSATKWIGGHGTTIGGVIVETGSSDWQANSQRFPQLHGKRAGREGLNTNYYKLEGDEAYMNYLRLEMVKDMGCCLSPLAAQQLFIGSQTLSLRCERQAKSTHTLAHWLRAHHRVAWVSFIGFEDHPYHHLAKKYLRNGFGSIFTFGFKGGLDEGRKLTDAFRLIISATNLGDSKTIIGNHWSTTHKGSPPEVNEMLGVREDLYRLSVGTEDVRDIIEDFEYAFKSVKALLSD